MQVYEGPEPPIGSTVRDHDDFLWDRGEHYWQLRGINCYSRSWHDLLRKDGPVSLTDRQGNPKEETTMETPKDTVPGDLQQDTLGLLKLLVGLDWQRLADTYPEFEDWSEAHITECLVYAERCVTKPNDVARERAMAELKTAVEQLKAAFKPFLSND
jgi:hypothetical protein